ncbi:undecaprenyl-diphosphatase [Salsuginibacillus halophilus]|uniref:Undecaprenyl-diphosphatase n=1 Tax=Salsuginibacillus halophilus TaxID=517424 RepID=A0A2P8HXN0_9BACI|nr:undecaprenyl-diphosphate phosphatase [Salsuginibacillus halophilus]PSL50982.1 undecaprenyl-diphosphatase [Salsuginibacillus halophilus]
MNLWELLQYIWLGVLQGLTEPWPVSSSGHLVIFQHFFGLGTPDLHFEVFLNGASLLAVLLIYRKDLVELAGGTVRYTMSRDPSYYPFFRLTLMLFIATIPAVVIGGLFSDEIGGELTTTTSVAVALLVTGTALWLIHKLNGSKQEGEITALDAVIIGLAQMLALAPGISRSGATIVAAMFRKIEPTVALKFSFFLSIPVSVGSLLLLAPEIYVAWTQPDQFMYYTISFIAATLVSIVAIKVLIDAVASGKLLYFALYCFTVATLLFIFS